MKLIDNKMKKLGYVRVAEDAFGAYYEKREPQGYDHVVCVIHKRSGAHIMQSYDKEVLEVNGDYVNEGAGVEIKVLLLMWLKAKYLSRKYHWRKRE